MSGHKRGVVRVTGGAEPRPDPAVLTARRRCLRAAERGCIPDRASEPVGLHRADRVPDARSTSSSDLAVNTIGGYSGTVRASAPSIAVITSDGDWTLTPA